MFLDMKNKLWTFGDSFTFGDGCKSDLNFKYESHYPKGDDYLWPNLVSNNLGLELINKGYSGFSNSAILRTLIQSLHQIKKNDIVVISKTDSFRFEIPSEYDMIQILVSNVIDANPSETYLREYIKNVHLPYHQTLDSELDISFKSIQTLLNSIGVKNFIWSYSAESEYNLSDEFYLYENINDATNGVIQDHHFSWKGHELFSKRIIEILTKL